MATTQNIQDFYFQAQGNDFARRFQFRIDQWVVRGAQLVPDQLVYLETASLPARAVTNVPVPFMGLQFNVPGTANYPGSDGYQVVFRCDQQYNIRTLLESATFAVFDDQTSTGDYDIPGNGDQLTLNLLNKNGETERQYMLFGAYVVNTGDIAYDLRDAGTIVTCAATIAYQYWRVTKE